MQNYREFNQGFNDENRLWTGSSAPGRHARDDRTIINGTVIEQPAPSYAHAEQRAHDPSSTTQFMAFANMPHDHRAPGSAKRMLAVAVFFILAVCGTTATVLSMVEDGLNPFDHLFTLVFAFAGGAALAGMGFAALGRDET